MIHFSAEISLPLSALIRSVSRFGDSHGYVAQPWLSPKRHLLKLLHAHATLPLGGSSLGEGRVYLSPLKIDYP